MSEEQLPIEYGEGSEAMYFAALLRILSRYLTKAVFGFLISREVMSEPYFIGLLYEILTSHYMISLHNRIYFHKVSNSNCNLWRVFVILLQFVNNIFMYFSKVTFHTSNYF